MTQSNSVTKELVSVTGSGRVAVICHETWTHIWESSLGKFVFSKKIAVAAVYPIYLDPRHCQKQRDASVHHSTKIFEFDGYGRGRS